MIDRSDEGMEVRRGMGHARHGREHETMTDEHAQHEHHRAEMHQHMGGGGEGASMARSPAAAHSAASREPGLKGGIADHSVSSGRGIKSGQVEAEHTMGSKDSVGVKSAEGEPDMASSKANRKEQGEPEREMAEQHAMGHEREVPVRNAMGHGMRETKANHTI